MISAAELLQIISRKQVDSAEVFLSSSTSFNIDVLDGEIESVDEARDTGCGIRIINNKRLGFAYTSEFEESVIEETIDQAIENARSSEADEHNAFPNDLSTQPPIDLNLYDPVIARTPVKDKIELALKIEASAYRTDKRVKKTEKVSYSDSETEVWISNSNGVNVSFKTNYCCGHAQIVSVQGQEMEAGFGVDFVKKFDALDPEKIGKEAARRASGLLGARAVPSQKVPLVIDPMVGTNILDVLANALSSDAVLKGKSLFAGKLGNQVGSGILSIFDNGRIENGLASAPFDAEGVPTQETSLVGNGILKNFFYDTYNACKGGTRSTGNAVRGSFSVMPRPGPTNLYIPAGKSTPDEIIRSIDRGLYIQRVMGIHTANPISGDFSIGAAGFMIERGEISFPVRSITIAGNLIEMLKAVEGVASDLRFIANTGSPTLLISGISVGGH